jgi:hypothetical protein
MQPEIQEDIRGRLLVVVHLLTDELRKNRDDYLTEACLHALNALNLALEEGDEACRETGVFPSLGGAILSLAGYYDIELDIALRLARLKR